MSIKFFIKKRGLIVKTQKKELNMELENPTNIFKIIKEGGVIIGKEVGKKLITEADEEIGKMITSKITKEIVTELMKTSGKTSIYESI